MKTILRQCFSLINPSLSSTYTNGGAFRHYLLKFPENLNLSSRVGTLSEITEVYRQ